MHGSLDIREQGDRKRGKPPQGTSAPNTPYTYAYIPPPNGCTPNEDLTGRPEGPVGTDGVDCSSSSSSTSPGEGKGYDTNDTGALARQRSLSDTFALGTALGRHTRPGYADSFSSYSGRGWTGEVEGVGANDAEKQRVAASANGCDDCGHQRSSDEGRDDEYGERPLTPPFLTQASSIRRWKGRNTPTKPASGKGINFRSQRTLSIIRVLTL